MKWYVRSVIRYRVIMITILFFITASSLAILSTAEISTNIEELFFGDSPDFRAYQERVAEAKPPPGKPKPKTRRT